MLPTQDGKDGFLVHVVEGPDPEVGFGVLPHADDGGDGAPELLEVEVLERGGEEGDHGL